MRIFGIPPFEDRRDAGRRLAGRLAPYRDERPVVFALPRGGVPVGYEISRALERAAGRPRLAQTRGAGAARVRHRRRRARGRARPERGRRLAARHTRGLPPAGHGDGARGGGPAAALLQGRQAGAARRRADRHPGGRRPRHRRDGPRGRRGPAAAAPTPARPRRPRVRRPDGGRLRGQRWTSSSAWISPRISGP